MNFLSAEKKRQTSWKLTTKLLPRKAKEPGLYRGRLYPFCLPIDFSPHNLFLGIRDDVLAYFHTHAIVWHGAALPGLPTNHLVSSQIFALNVLYPFMYRPEALAAFLAPYLPDIQRMDTFEDGRLLQFEWIGAQNYLSESGHLGGGRMRGAGNTSIDAVARYTAQDGRKVMALIEWKYSESYASSYIRFRSDGTDRAETYGPVFFADYSPMNLDRCHDLDAFMFEPFYQLMRHQLLAAQITTLGGEDVDEVKVVHFHCLGNQALRSVTSPVLRQFGTDSYTVWRELIRDQSRFVTIPIEELMKYPIEKQFPDLTPWRLYLRERYAGIC